MIITRKVQIFINENDKDLKKEHLNTLYRWRDAVRRVANVIISHKFVQDNIKDFFYLKDEVKEKFYVSDLLRDEKGMSEQNVTYKVASALLKGKVPSDIYTCLNQAVVNIYKKTRVEVVMGRASLRSYKNSIPVPFSAKALSSTVAWSSEDKRFYFSLFGLPFGTALGGDLSGNKAIIDRCISGEYKLCSSSISINDKKKKIFLYICVDIPQAEAKLSEGVAVYAMLSIDTPIRYFIGGKDFDLSGMDKVEKIYSIGSKEEFLHGRLQIQAALHRTQVAAKYNRGGHGRTRKLQSTERFSEKETNYVATKLHAYSRWLVDAAAKAGASTIMLVEQPAPEEAKDNPFLLRNWSYFSLEEKVRYKAAMVGITIDKAKLDGLVVQPEREG
ncbi:MAG: hypothetical protein LBK18_08900 [Prevotellaceae bacterium]|jgi:hypothetical protein|nr:hypothetical protein [Prevotellaceae bacterium]